MVTLYRVVSGQAVLVGSNSKQALAVKPACLRRPLGLRGAL